MARRRVCVGICTTTRSNASAADGELGVNPLGWALASLAAQDITVDRIWVLKHGESSSAFERLIGMHSRSMPILVEHWDRDHHPVGRLRNRLLELAGEDLLYVLDDDAILSTSSTLRRQLRAFAAGGDRMAVLQAPVLRRTTKARPVGREQLATVARVDGATGRVSFGFDRVAADGAAGSTSEPIDIDHLCLAQSLLDPRRVGQIGGFTNFPWPAVYGQESELGVRLVEAGWKVAYLPDAAAAIVHLKFGAPQWNPPDDDDDVELPGGVHFADAARLAAGDGGGPSRLWSRKPSAGFFADYVSGFGAVFAILGPHALTRFLVDTAWTFVVENRLHHPFVLPIADRDERASAFDEGIARLVAADMLDRSTQPWSAVLSATGTPAGDAPEVWI